MSSTIKIKRSSQSGNAPDTNNIVEGELALNTADGVLYSRGGNDIFEVGSNLTTADIDVLVVNDSAQINGKLEVSPSTASDTISLGSTAQTGTITLGQSTATNTINIGNANTGSIYKQTINIGDNGVTGSETEITVGTDDSASTTTIQGLTKIDQSKPNFVLPTGDNSITTVSSSGKHIKFATIEFSADGEYYGGKFEAFYTNDNDNRPSAEFQLFINCNGVGSSPTTRFQCVTNNYFAETNDGIPSFFVRLESNVGGVMKFHVFGRIMDTGLGMEIFKKEQSKSDTVKVTYEDDNFSESDYINFNDVIAIGDTSYSANNMKIHTTASYHWDDLFGDEPGMVRTTGGRSANSIRVVTPSDGFLHYDSSNNTFSHKFDMVPNDPTTSITIGANDDASTVILQGRTKILDLAPRVITPTGDNGIGSIPTNGKHIKIATINLGASGEYYKVNLGTNYHGTSTGLAQDITRHTIVFLSQGIGNNPAIQIRNYYDDATILDTYPEIKIRWQSDVAGGGAGPVRGDVYLVGKVVANGMNVYVRDEFVGGGASLRSDITWYESPDATDYLTATQFGNLAGSQNLGTKAAGFNTLSNNMDDLFGTTAGIVKTTGGTGTSAISAVALSEGFLHYDSAEETFSHTFDMLPSDPATSITIGDSDGTGLISLGTSKVQQAVNINAGVGTTNGSVKQTNISTGQTGGSCDINIGPTDAGVTSLVDILGTINIAGNRVGDTITIGKISQSGNINIGIATVGNTLTLNNGGTQSLSTKTTKIGGNGVLGSTENLDIGYNDQDNANSTIRIGNTGSATNSVTIYGDTTFSNGDVNIDDNLEVDGTINGRYGTVFTSGSNMTDTAFLANSGKKIIHKGSSNFTIQDFQPTAADVGKHWTIINATTAVVYVKLIFGTQYVRLMSGSTQYAIEDNWRIGRAGVAELVCVNNAASGGTQSNPNFILYGNNLDTE